MNTLKIVILLLATFGSIFASPSTFRTFTDTQGREMEAKLTRVSGDDVYIERQDGLNTKVSISMFSDADQTFIRDWAREQLIVDGAIEVRFTTEVTEKSRFTSNGGGILSKKWKQAYGIVVKNTTYENLENIRIEYMILKFEDALAAQKRSQGEIRILRGKSKIGFIKAGGEASTETKQFPMLETKLEDGYVWAGGGKKESEDEMRGIWVRVYVNDILATELSRPESMRRNYSWEQ